MFSPIKSSLILLFALPMTAVADPVSVTVRSSGQIDLPDPLVLDRLGLETPDESVPYQLTVRSIFDPGSAGYGDLRDLVIQDPGDLDISLKLGTQSYHFADKGYSDVQVYKIDDTTDGYEYDITFNPPEASGNYSMSIWNRMAAPTGTSTGHSPLATRSIDFGTHGFTQFVAFPSNPDAPGFWTMFPTIETYSLQVSPVPEPATLGMLAAGMLAVAGWRRRTTS